MNLQKLWQEPFTRILLSTSNSSIEDGSGYSFHPYLYGNEKGAFNEVGWQQI